MPLVFWGIYEIIYRDKDKYWLLVIGMSGLILSHLITSVLTFLVLVVICLVNIKKLIKEKQRIIRLIYSVLFTVLITGYFLFPFLEQMLSQKYSVNYVMNDFSISNYTSRIERLLLKNVINHDVWSDNNFLKLILIIGVVCLLFSTNLFPWNLRVMQKLFSFMQFPWRILSIATVLILISFGIYYAKSKYLDNHFFTNMIVLFAIPTIFVFNLYNLSAIYLQDTLGSDFETISFGEYLPISDVVTGWGNGQSDYYYDRENVAISNGSVELKTIRKNKYLIVNYDKNSKSSEIVLPLLYYKGYDITINNKNVKYFKSNEGLIKVNVDNDKSEIVAYYKGTSLAYYTKIISFISVICFVILIVKQKKKCI